MIVVQVRCTTPLVRQVSRHPAINAAPTWGEGNTRSALQLEGATTIDWTRGRCQRRS